MTEGHIHTYLTPAEVAKRLKVTRRAVYRWLTGGRLRGVKAGSGWRVSEAALARFLGEEK